MLDGIVEINVNYPILNMMMSTSRFQAHAVIGESTSLPFACTETHKYDNNNND